MKNRSLIPLATLVLAVIIAFGSVSFLGPCVHEDGSFGACHWAGQALLGVGILVAVQSIAALLCKDGSVRRGILLAMVPSALLGIFIPGTLIHLCGMATMRCRSVMRPAMSILFGLILVLTVIGLLTERRKIR